jgi:broad specificity phosphatase PhoE
MITVTIVRHGESTDNLRPVWAGWADAPLSNHGMNQAKAVGASFADLPIDAVFASPLKRAHWTGQQIQLQNKNDPPLTVSPLLREQGFGVG